MAEDITATCDKEVLVKIVKLAQTRKIKGIEGEWKDFLQSHDKKFGSSLSDPSRRSIDILAAFVKTITGEEDVKLITNLVKLHENYKSMEFLMKNSQHPESPEQKLVRLTMEHPEYLKRYSFPSYNEDWVITRVGKISKVLKSNAMVAVDCEMVLCQDGTEEVVKVCVVDQNMEVKLDKLVNPMKVVSDYRTDITGITEEDLKDVSCCLSDIQILLKKLLKPGMILVGHSLHNDLQALKIDHRRVIDTSFIFSFLDRPRHYSASLYDLCKLVLGFELRKEGAPHVCMDDARATMKLVLAKLEHGFDEPIAVPLKDDTPESDLTKLLIHKLPATVSLKELLKIFPDMDTVELQPFKTSKSNQSAFAIFKDPTWASKAFDMLDGELGEDSGGRPQKLVSVELKGGQNVSFFVRKMTSKEFPIILKKRLAQVEMKGECKRQKADKSNVCEHIKEIEQLQHKLQEKDQEIKSLQKILSSLTRKHGL
ncbi:small RNA degrading nuclease 1 isoform X1 [Amborella trichopoda]|uniref:Exonuclease domain-containing protein n=1 Tax=Amborella trichopoda TaxID=13333 RepID=W1NXJ3_AMBTC|nr:small RNA degrading nuclease 1 isoform X1 [Amborella trichopoda]XP_011620856.1 small RNA degrading nuclease 1 isoform X1 [Amborella trichopoda]ERM99404.1 hypothetical protein AMTR_s00131p00040500 [Amborella trichopoda]|eukprot:XP_006836551.1 small RNA degrading nuclease 1 isoform X1 [Amborella trichopoda]